MDLKQLEYINAIAEEGNLSRAAEKLFITQSALSQQLKKLRNEGLPPLFEERKHRMELTDAGRIYLTGARAILRIDRLAREEISRKDLSSAARTRIAVSGSASLPFGACVLPKLRKRMPDAKISVLPCDISTVRALLRERELDFAILPDVFQQDDMFCYEPLYRDELVIAALSDADLRTLPFTLPSVTSPLRQMCDRSFSLRGEYPDVYMETSDPGIASYLVRNGLSAAVLPKSEVNDPLIRTVSFEEKCVFTTVCMFDPDRRSLMVKAVLDLWRSVFGDRPPAIASPE